MAFWRTYFAGKDLIALLIGQQMLIAKVPTDSHSFSTYIGCLLSSDRPTTFRRAIRWPNGEGSALTACAVSLSPLTQNLVMILILTSSTSPAPLLPLGRSRHPYHAADEYPNGHLSPYARIRAAASFYMRGQLPYAGRNLGLRVWGHSKYCPSQPLCLCGSERVV